MGHIDPAAYDSWYHTPFGAFCHRCERDAVFSLAKLRRGESVLDAGCGTGVYLEELSCVGVISVGLDDNEEMLAFAARNKSRGTRLIRGALTDIPFEGRSFDEALCVCALEFVAQPEEAICEMARVLKPGGALILGFLNGNSEWARLRTGKGKNPLSVWRGARFYTLAEITGMAERCGLKPKGFKGAVHFPPEAEGKDIAELEAMETKGRQRSPFSAAFMAAAFSKSG